MIENQIVPKLQKVQEVDKINQKQTKKLLLIAERMQNLEQLLSQIKTHPLIEENFFKLKS